MEEEPLHDNCGDFDVKDHGKIMIFDYLKDGKRIPCRRIEEFSDPQRRPRTARRVRRLLSKPLALRIFVDALDTYAFHTSMQLI